LAGPTGVIGLLHKRSTLLRLSIRSRLAAFRSAVAAKRRCFARRSSPGLSAAGALARGDGRQLSALGALVYGWRRADRR